MDIFRDFRELFESFNAAKVEHIVVGGYALAHHGKPRYTRDIDLYVRPTRENAERVIKALDAYGFTFPDLTAEDFQKPDQVVQIGYPPVRVDLIMSIAGVSWDEAYAGRSQGDYDGEPVP
ncbi:MAG: nucleotidyl transferase AbiEii/AbiGii toxin family protein [Phycisphaerae bacterium]